MTCSPTTSRRRAAAALPLLLAPLLLTACASGAATTGGSGSGSGSTAGGSALASAKAEASAISSALHSGSTVKQSGPVTTGEQLCALVPPAEVGSALQATVTESGASTYLNDEPLCGYSGGTRSGSMNQPVIGITVVWGPVADDPYDTSAMFGEGSATDVSGVGQKAAVKDGGFEALIGDHTLQFLSVGTTTPSNDRLVALAKVFAAKL